MRCTRSFASLIIYATHLLVDSFFIFNGAEDVGTMYIILLIPRSASKVFDGVGRGFDIHFVELGIMIKKFILMMTICYLF